MLEYPMPEWQEKKYTNYWIDNMRADNHQYLNSCLCQCCQRINILKTLAGPLPFAENSSVWIMNYYQNGWEKAIFLGRSKPDFCEDKVRYEVHTATGYCSRDLNSIRSSPPND